MKYVQFVAPIIAVVAVSTALSWAQDQKTSPANPRSPKAEGVHVVHRASKLIGMSVHNAGGKELGSVNDVVIDLTNGKVRYLALSYGGWAGLGDKLFAIPLSSFQTKYDAENKAWSLVLNVPEAKLKGAPGFDESHWPDFANDNQWHKKIDTYFELGE